MKMKVVMIMLLALIVSTHGSGSGTVSCFDNCMEFCGSDLKTPYCIGFCKGKCGHNGKDLNALAPSSNTIQEHRKIMGATK
ncbi:hypothetical protein CASFOL_012986 [Castilleja foliolosa]|uniref:Uncharacterized protein n=1 Tax=Castilleja foliolosa TaxID=1961234 RepID=A0ABD3DIN7_9LAMI